MPLVAVFEFQVSTTANGTLEVLIQSPFAVAGACAMTLPLASTSTTGKLPSKYQVPMTLPVTGSGLFTLAPMKGVVSVGRSFCSLALEVVAAGSSGGVIGGGTGVGGVGSSAIGVWAGLIRVVNAKYAAAATAISESVMTSTPNK